MADSTLTLAGLKARSEDLLDIDSAQSDLNDLTILIATNDFLQEYQTIEMVEYPNKWRKTHPLTTIPSTGYELSNIVDLYGTKAGFKVYLKSVANENRLFEVRKGGPQYGYYIEEGKIFIYQGSESIDKEVVIQYFNSQFEFATTQEINTTVIPIERGLERGLELMVGSRYLERDQADPQRAINMRNDSLSAINAFFVTNQSLRIITKA